MIYSEAGTDPRVATVQQLLGTLQAPDLVNRAKKATSKSCKKKKREREKEEKREEGEEKKRY